MLNCPLFWKITQSQFYTADWKPLITLDEQSLPGHGIELERNVHGGLPYIEGRRPTDEKLQFKLGSVGGLQIAFCSY